MTRVNREINAILRIRTRIVVNGGAEKVLERKSSSAGVVAWRVKLPSQPSLVGYDAVIVTGAIREQLYPSAIYA